MIEPDPRIEPGTPYSVSDIEDVERWLGRALPEDYRRFVEVYGGAFVGGTIDGSNALPILHFLRAGNERGILAVLEEYADLKEEGALPFESCELGNIYVLTRSDEVFYINCYGGRTTAVRVAAGFSEFLSRIVISKD